jgi:hypothetical protein
MPAYRRCSVYWQRTVLRFRGNRPRRRHVDKTVSHDRTPLAAETRRKACYTSDDDDYDESDDDDEASPDETSNKRTPSSTDKSSVTQSTNDMRISERIKLRTLSLKSTSRQLIGKSVSHICLYSLISW